MRELTDYLEITEGITTIIGSGGKTSLMKRLSEELTDESRKGMEITESTVILTTSTHILPYANMALYTGEDVNELQELARSEKVLCTGKPDGIKLQASAISFDEMARVAAKYVIVEGDGSNRLPLKAHADWEPVIPYESNQVILVVGASGWDRKINEAVHRPELFSAQGAVFSVSRELADETPVSPEIYAGFVAYELENRIIDIPSGARLKIFINQVDSCSELDKARRFAYEFRKYHADKELVPIVAGSLHNNKYELI